MKLRSVHHRLEIDQDDENGNPIQTFLKVNGILEITDNVLIKVGGKAICIISKSD